MQLFCAECEKPIDGNGKIHEGRPYHSVCLEAMWAKEDGDRMEELELKYPFIPDYTLSALVDDNSYEEVVKWLKAPWVAIISDDDGAPTVFTARNKAALMDDLNEELIHCAVEGLAFGLEHVIYRGKNYAADWNVKITLERV